MLSCLRESLISLLALSMNSEFILYGILLVRGIAAGDARRQYNCESVGSPVIISIQDFPSGMRIRRGVLIPNFVSIKLNHSSEPSGRGAGHAGIRTNVGLKVLPSAVSE